MICFVHKLNVRSLTSSALMTASLYSMIIHLFILSLLFISTSSNQTTLYFNSVSNLTLFSKTSNLVELVSNDTHCSDLSCVKITGTTTYDNDTDTYKNDNSLIRTTVDTSGYHNISIRYDIVATAWSDVSKFQICLCNSGSCGPITSYKSQYLSQWNDSGEIHSQQWFPDEDSWLRDNQSVSVCFRCKAVKNPQDLIVYLDNIEWIGYPLPTTSNPTIFPTTNPTIIPTVIPTMNPTVNPSISPTVTPSNEPSIYPTTSPTTDPSIFPTSTPTDIPTKATVLSVISTLTVNQSTDPLIGTNTEVIVFEESASPIIINESSDSSITDPVLIGLIGALSGILVVGTVGCIVAWFMYRRYVLKSVIRKKSSMITPTAVHGANQQGVIVDSISFAEGSNSVRIEIHNNYLQKLPKIPSDPLNFNGQTGVDQEGADSPSIQTPGRKVTDGKEGFGYIMDRKETAGSEGVGFRTTPNGNGSNDDDDDDIDVELDKRVSQIQI